MYFNINYEFSTEKVLEMIERYSLDAVDSTLRLKSGYICVADGNILQMVHRDIDYRDIVNGSVFSVCDSSWVPVFLKWIYGMRVRQYSGSELFHDILSLKRYRQFFMGGDEKSLLALKKTLSEIDLNVDGMPFESLPFCDVDGFDYKAIGDMINEDGPDIIWLSLGAPKQEIFASKLVPYLNRGIIIPVGAVFNFYSGINERRAPKWMIRFHLEFLFRIIQSPKKQLGRCLKIISSLPSILMEEMRK